MVRSAATSTRDRKQKTLGAIYSANYNQDPCVRGFGINVGNEFTKVTARVLTPPRLEYKNTEVFPQKGVWRNESFIDGRPLNNWTVLNLARTRDDAIDTFCSLFKRIAEQQCKMLITEVRKPFQKIMMRNPSDLQAKRQLEAFFQKNKSMDLIIVIVPDYPTNIYSLVKHQAEIEVGCLTQCIKERTMFKSLNAATVANILLKVNAKLNGVNHKIARVSRPKCLMKPCMIMGADVTHPPPESISRPSVAAVAASHDPAAFQYNICWRLQPAKKEIILDLENIVREQLIFFYEKTRFKPESIIFFRDGVSEGQFNEVLNNEFSAIRRACTALNEDYKPKITFLVVQKRHHTRFFPVDPRDSEDRNCNVPAGTCVDTEIIHPSDIEYYLVSHASIQGVARPTKYRMLWDDNDMSDDEIQELTYFLCHLFTRCNRSVSYPAPTYYAHLAAFRASVYFEGKEINMDRLQWEQEKNQIKIEIAKGKPMFFV